MRPDDPEVQKWIEASVVAHMATLSRKEVPALTPLWFVCYRGHLYMATARATLAARNIAAHSSVVLLLHGEQRGKQNQNPTSHRKRKIKEPVCLFSQTIHEVLLL